MAHPVVHVLTMVLVGVAFVSGVATGIGAFRTRTITIHKTVRVQKSWGKPDSTVDGTQVNAAFKGLTCEIFEKRKTIVCHP